MQDKDYVYNLNHSTNKEKQSSEVASQPTTIQGISVQHESPVNEAENKWEGTLVKPLPFKNFPPCPPQERNIWCLTAAHACSKEGLSKEEATRIIREQLTRPPHPKEIERAVAKAYNTDTSAEYQPPITAEYQPEKLQAVAEKIGCFGVDELRKKSRLQPDTSSTIDFLHSLYLPGERALLFDKYNDRDGIIWERQVDGIPYDNNELDSLKKPHPGKGAWFIANPVNGEWKYLERLKDEDNPKGMSMRAEENLTAYRYMVIESDKAPADLWLSALAQLPLPITSITTSGGRSLHALIRVDARTAQEWRRIKQRLAPALVTLGADKGALTIVRLTRLPGCYRAEKNQWQALLYINPEADGTPICKLPDLRS